MPEIGRGLHNSGKSELMLVVGRRFREGRWSGGWRALNCSENAPKRPEGQLASIRLVTGPTETQIGIGGARNSQECGLRPILGRSDQEPRDMLRALKKDLKQILKPQNFCSRSQSCHPEWSDEIFKAVNLSCKPKPKPKT